MAELKTKRTTQDPYEYLKTIEPEEKRQDCLTLIKLFEKVTGQDAVMWGTSIVGFGMYHYKSERSRQEGDWPLAAFAPRVQNLTLYSMMGNEDSKDLFEKLGKYKVSGSCLHIKRLSDVDLEVLEQIIKRSYDHSKKTLL
ncbi:MAG: hypothetical protein UZ21_OP11001000260 [Microgenomates bacterium OLB22]|nr:MAG: hypothetical protein UZ21_OP11001000260 [Microgenomates bacterium OLB22]